MKKIISIILIISIMIGNINSYAFEKISEFELVKIRDCESLLTYKNRTIKTSYIETMIEGNKYPCYCINPELDGVGELGSYKVNGEEKLEKNSLIYKVIINGYPYKSLNELGVNTEDEAYTATKQAIYSMIYERYTDMSCYGSVNTESGKRTLNALNKIVKNALNEDKKDEICEVKALSDWIIKENLSTKKYKIEGDNVKEYKIKIQGNVPESLVVKKDGNYFEIEVPLRDMKECVDFLINIETKIETKPVLYGKTLKENSQNYAIAGIKFEDIKLEYQDSYDKNNTSLKIIKIDNSTKEKLEGVKFKLLNGKKEILINDIVTDENGEIILENVLPGKYYIQEIETLDEYEIYKELIEVYIEYNEEKVIEIENTKKEIPEKSDIPKLPKTGF